VVATGRRDVVDYVQVPNRTIEVIGRESNAKADEAGLCRNTPCDDQGD
jgi:hypothetical protein